MEKDRVEEPTLRVGGAALWKGYLDRAAQVEMLADIRRVVAAAPLYSPMTPWGKPMRVQMTSAGKFGWYSDRSGYRYEPRHPAGGDWPPIPPSVLSVWTVLSGSERLPECCLINLYRETARMGLHQDKDEADFDEPVLSISLGDEGLFRIGGTERSEPTQSVWLSSGDVLLLDGPARLAYHGIDRIKQGSSDLLDGGGRLNLTLRVVT